MEDPRIQEAARKFTEAYGSVVFAARDLDPAGLREGVAAVLAMSAIYVAHVDEVPSLSTTPHEIAEEASADEVVDMWEALKRHYLLLRSVGGFDVKGLEALLERLRMTEQRADQLQARLDAVEKRAFEAARPTKPLGTCRKSSVPHPLQAAECVDWRPEEPRNVPDPSRTELDVPCDYCGAVVGRGCEWGPEPHDDVFHLTRAARFLEEEKDK